MVNYVVQFQINIYAIMILVVVLILIQLRSKVEFYSKKLLKMVIIINIIALVMEPITWISDGNSTGIGYIISYGSNFLLVLLGPVLAGSLVAYADYKILNDRSRLKRCLYCLIPAIIVVLLLIVNFFYPVFFTIDRGTGIYAAAPLQWINYLIILGIYLYVYILLYKNRNKTNTRVVLFVLLFFALPIIGMIIQIFYIQLCFSWSTVSLGILIAYAFLEMTTGEKDYLTQLYSRAIYEEYVKFLIEEKRDFQIMMIDLDGFKAINDKFGHHIGDQVLIEFSNILQRVFPSEKMISRLAGDEFIIVIQNNTQEDETIIQDIVALCKASLVAQVHNLQFSYGFQVHSEDLSFDELYIKVDNNMYLNKHS
ncbi:MAG: GGDEF domain-containing protein [Bacteroidetes bacterium]|nr:GGDEF domain-containing protein [Bacteroidota bacterium]